MIQYGATWAPTGINAEELARQMGGCVEAKFGSAQPPNVDAIIKNPDAVNGQLFVMVTDISQFDAATGACAFRGYWDTQEHQYNFDYAGDNAFFTSGDGFTACPVLSGIDQNDVVRVWALSKGSKSYATQIGGNTTVPEFKVLRAQIIRKA